MKFAFNALHLVYGERDGVETEFEQFLRHTAAICEPDTLAVLANRETAQRMDFPPRVEVIACPVEGANVFRRVWYEHRFLPGVCRDYNVDAALFFGAVLPLRLSVPGVLLINDLQPWHYPENFSWHKRLYLRTFVPPSARHAAAVVTISQFSKNDIVRVLDIPPEKIEIVTLSGPAYSRVDDPEIIAAARAKYDLPARYLMCLASSYPHKNLDGLVRAYALYLKDHPGSDLHLALPGMPRQAHNDIRTIAERLEISHRVHQPGRIDKEDLAALYSGAEAFVFPSKFEGFGMPVLEAMACGTPVLSSTAAALPEVYGDAALEFEPDDIHEMAAAISRITDDEAVRCELIEQGYEQVKRFSWERSARKILGILRRAAETTVK